MAYNPNVPAPTNRVQDDIAAMRENFQHLDPLAQAVDELQAVSGLAAVAGELQAVSELAPYVQALLDSRIVDHNLDVANPPNGHYVRWENGLQICWVLLTLDYHNDVTLRNTWHYPSSFDAVLVVVHTPNTHAVSTNLSAGARASLGLAGSNWSPISDLSFVHLDIYADSGVFQSDTYMGTHALAVGRWK